LANGNVLIETVSNKSFHCSVLGPWVAVIAEQLQRLVTN